MFKISRIYDRLQRRTNAGGFISQVDGLRFFAILPVVLAHLNIFIVSKTSLIIAVGSSSYFISEIINDSARKGVLLFFVISGFILATPFAKQFLYEGEIISLKSYFLRRLTRLEPPYILNNIAYAVLLVLFASHEYKALFPTESILQHLGASLLYIHNFIFPDHVAINYVTWSLEVEVQFYLLVPLLVLVFKLDKTLRRISLLSLVFLFPLLQHYYTPNFLSIYSFIQYFLIGFMLTDLYLSGSKIKMSKTVDFITGIVSLLGMLYFNIVDTVYGEYGFMISLTTFCALVLMGNFWKKVLSVRFLTTIGGMCYSIYLWHTAVISGLGNYITHIGISGHYFLTLFLQSLIILPAVLVFSTIVYVLIERPCMDKNWPAKLWYFISVKLKISKRN